MRKSFFLTLLLTSVSIATYSQNTFPSSGNVGIGTTSPSEELQVVGKVKAEHGIFTKKLLDGSEFESYEDRNKQCSVLNAGTQLGPSGYILNVLDFPQSNLNAKAQSFIGMEDRNYKSRWRYYANTGGSSELLYYDKSQKFIYSLKEDGNSVFLTLPNEKSFVTIGTSSFDDNGDTYHLTVNGKMRAHAVKVYTDWADFVFEEDYKLPTLLEVEKYIQTHGHLKDIPSAKEVEASGIELGEMNKLLLQKIEELTLYTIKLKKEVEELKTKID